VAGTYEVVGMSDKYTLNGAMTLDAALWFMSREKLRHQDDIRQIERDIAALKALGAKLPTGTPLDVYFAVPGSED
jgi:hypothetical protein